MESFASMSIALDSIRVLPAVTPFRSVTIAGREPGFQDGQGSDIRCIGVIDVGERQHGIGRFLFERFDHGGDLGA